jgi:hypothetical protein
MKAVELLVVRLSVFGTLSDRDGAALAKSESRAVPFSMSDVSSIPWLTALDRIMIAAPRRRATKQTLATRAKLIHDALKFGSCISDCLVANNCKECGFRLPDILSY